MYYYLLFYTQNGGPFVSGKKNVFFSHTVYSNYSMVLYCGFSHLWGSVECAPLQTVREWGLQKLSQLSPHGNAKRGTPKALHNDYVP